jgi:hypothetical protein
MTPFYYFSFFLNEFPIILPLLQVKKKKRRGGEWVSLVLPFEKGLRTGFCFILFLAILIIKFG